METAKFMRTQSMSGACCNSTIGKYIINSCAISYETKVGFVTVRSYTGDFTVGKYFKEQFSFKIMQLNYLSTKKSHYDIYILFIHYLALASILPFDF